MSSIEKRPPDQSLMREDGRWDWETEETLVDRQKRLGNRIRRFIKNTRLYLLFAMIFTIALLDAEFMTGLLSVLGFALQMILFASVFLLQFVVLFWFLGRARMYEIMPGAEGISFDDYRGQPEILEQAQQIVTLLRGVKAFEGSGGEPLNGLLLEGPPGTGKTWLAQAISTEAGVPFFYADASSLQGMFIGTSEMKVMGLYRKARRYAKEYGAAVVFLDEIDSVGARGDVSRVGDGGNVPPGGSPFGGGGFTGILSTLLIEMSGFSQEHGWRARWRTRFYKYILRRKPPKPERRVLTIGATNRITALDPALLRPGRFDKKIRVDVPDLAGRRDIFEYYLTKMAHDESMNPDLLATETPGYTPADIKYLLNEALRYALFDGRRYITYRDFARAQPEHEVGLRAPLKHMSTEARMRLAYYQAGRAVAVRLFLPHHRIARITIIRQGYAFGHVKHYAAQETYQGMTTRDEFYDYLRVWLSGRAAEIEFCGVQFQSLEVTQPHSPDSPGDLVKVRMWLQNMARAGMFGPLGGALGFAGLSEDMNEAIEHKAQELLMETRRALRENAEIVHALVRLLLEKEELLAEDVRAFFDQYGLFTPDPQVTLEAGGVDMFAPAQEEVGMLSAGEEASNANK